MLRILNLWWVFAWAIVAAQTENAATGVGPPPAAVCGDLAHRQFDFWLGDWDAVDPKRGGVEARVRVTPILGGCVLHEVYSQQDGLEGESFSIFDPDSLGWQQYWVTNRGQRLMIEGGFAGGAMTLESDRDQAGTWVRATWKPIDGGVRETAWRSSDGGKTRDQWFDLIFRPHKESEMHFEDDAAMVAELDRLYQAAVERNDAETMDHILADDFLIVTGAGKRFSKQDLLAEARSKQAIYERQDDSEKTVRVYGDTAIVTAQLFAKGTENGKPFEYSLWFTDVYRRTPAGWRYVYAQSSLPLPKTQQ